MADADAGEPSETDPVLSTDQTPVCSYLENKSDELIQEDSATLHHEHNNLDADYRLEEEFRFEEPTIPTSVVPLYKQRLVLLKIGDNFLRIGTGSKPVVSKIKPPLCPPVNADEDERLMDPKGPPKLVKEHFDFPQFTFFADESATMTESWYRNARAFFNIRLCVKRNGDDGSTEYLVATKTPNQIYEVQFDKHAFGSWWRLSSVSSDQYVAESVSYPGRCLMSGRFGLCLSDPITEQEKARIVKGKWNKARTLTIITLPDFAVWQPGVCVS